MSDESLIIVVILVACFVAYIGWQLLKALFWGGAKVYYSAAEKRELEKEALRQQILESRLRQYAAAREDVLRRVPQLEREPEE